MSAGSQPPLVNANGAKVHPPTVIHIVVHPDGKMELSGPLNERVVFMKILVKAMEVVLSQPPSPPPKISLWNKMFKRGRY